MKKNRFLLVLAFCLLALTSAVYGQAKEITADEFNAASRSAYDKYFETPRRIERTDEKYVDGKLSETSVSVSETDENNNYRHVSTKIIKGVPTKVEEIRIGDYYYRRENSGKWKKKEILIGLPMIGNIDAPPPDISNRFTVETTTLNGKAAKLYVHHRVFKETGGIKYDERKFWLDEEGLIVKEELITGFQETKKMISRTVFTCAYNPKDLKIEAPIK